MADTAREIQKKRLCYLLIKNRLRWSDAKRMNDAELLAIPKFGKATLTLFRDMNSRQHG